MTDHPVPADPPSPLTAMAGALRGTYGSEYPKATADDWKSDAEFMLARLQEYGLALASSPAPARLDVTLREALADASERILRLPIEEGRDGPSWLAAIHAAAYAVAGSAPAPAGLDERVLGALRDAAEQAHGFMHYGPFTDCEAAICVQRFELSRAALASAPAPAGLDESPAADDEAANQWQAMYPNVSYAARVAVRLWNRLIVAEGAATRPAEDAPDE